MQTSNPRPNLPSQIIDLFATSAHAHILSSPCCLAPLLSTNTCYYFPCLVVRPLACDGWNSRTPSASEQVDPAICVWRRGAVSGHAHRRWSKVIERLLFIVHERVMVVQWSHFELGCRERSLRRASPRPLIVVQVMLQSKLLTALCLLVVASQDRL